MSKFVFLRPMLLILCLFAAPVTAIATDVVLVHTARDDMTIGLRYQVFETGGAKPDAELPMVIAMHWAGDGPEMMREYFDTLDIPARIVMPRAPYPRGEGRSWFPNEYAVMGRDAQQAVAFDMAAKLAEFIAAMRERYPTRGKAVVTGISYGGDMSYLLALHHPQQVAMAFPVAARLLPEWMPAAPNCAPTCPPIRALHGDKDTTVAIDAPSAAMSELAKRGFDASLTPYAGAAHEFSAPMERDFVRQVKAWLSTAR